MDWDTTDWETEEEDKPEADPWKNQKWEQPDQPTLDANESIMSAHDSGVNPDQASQAYDVGEQNGVDMDTVLQDQNYWNAPKPMDNVNPVTSDYMKNFGTVFGGSAQPMNDVEVNFKNIQKNKHLYGGDDSFWSIKGEGLFARGVRTSKNEKRYNQLTFREFNGVATEEEKAEIGELKLSMQQEQQPTELQSWIVSPAQEMADSFSEYMRGYAYAPEAFQKGARLTASPTGGFVIATQAASVNSVYEGARDEGMGYWREMKDYRDLDGNPLDDDVLRGSTYFLMATSGLIENVPVFGALKKVFPDSVVSMFSRKGVKELIKTPTMREAFKKFGKSFAGGMTQEAATEMFQSVIQDLTGNVAIGMGAERASSDDLTGLSEMLGNAAHSFYEGMKGGWMMQGGSSGVELSGNLYKAKQAQAQINEITDITKNLNDDSLNTKSKSLTAQFIKDSSKRYDVSDSVMVDQEVVTRFYQETGLTSEEFAEQFPQTQEAMSESFETGGDIDVPLDELARIEASDKGEELLANFRVSAEAPTQAEVIQIEKEVAEFDAEREQEAMQNPIFEDIYQQLKNIGATDYVARQQALLWQLRIETRAKQHNISPEEMYTGSKLDLKEEDMREANLKDNYERLDSIMDMIRKGKQPSAKQAYGLSAVEYLSEQGGLIDTGGELSARDVGKVGTKNLIQPLEKGGLTLDQSIEKLVEAGYLSGETDQYVHEDVLQTLDDEMAGSPLYAQDQRTPDAELYEEVAGIEDMLYRMGIELDGMTNEEVKQTLKDATLFQDADSPQGYYERTPLRDVFRITLTGKADMSTFLHESGHAFLDMLIQDADQFEESKKDLDTLMKWMGVDSPDQIQTDQHEQFARGFEAYLREGKAPSKALKEAFRNFKLWLTNIYKQFRQLDVELTPEVTGVMDRLLATRADIDEAREDAGILPMFDELSQADKVGMSRAEWDDYRAKYNETMARQLEILEAKRITEYNNQIKFMNKERRLEATKQAEENLKFQYDPWMVLKGRESVTELPKTRNPDGSLIFYYDGKPRKLSKESVQRVFPDIPLAQLRGLYSVENGVDADVFAGAMGFNSGVDVVTKLANLPPHKEALINETARILKEEYGEQEKIPTAKDIVHGDNVTDFLKAELVALGQRGAVATEIRLQAKRKIQSTSISKIKPIVYERAERKAALASARALANGDRATSATEKRKQLLNHNLFKEATKALTNVDKQYKYLKTFDKKAVRKRVGLAGEHYLKGIDYLLENVQLRKVTDKFLNHKQAIQDEIAKMRAEGAPVSAELAAMVKQKNYREMTVDEFDTVFMSVKNIQSMAINKKRWLDANKKATMDENVETIVKQISDNKATISQKKTILNKVRSWFRRGDAELVKVEFLTRWFDGGEVGGKAHELIFVPFQDAEEKHLDMSLDYASRVMDIIEERGQHWRGSAFFMGEERERSEVIATALNIGNEGNLQRLVDGYGWNYDQLMKELEAQLTKDDWDAIQKIWDTIDELYDPMAEVAQRVEGEKPARVEKMPFKIGGRVYKGGYYPAMYDPELSSIGEAQDKDLGAKGFVVNNVKGSAAQARATKVIGALSLDLNNLPKHVNETIFYITHYEAVSNTYKLITRPEVKQAIRLHYGIEYYAALKDWLDAIAKEGLVYAKKGTIEKSVEYIRSATSLGAMGYNIPTAMVQPLGLFTAIPDVGLRHISAALLKVGFNPVKTWKQMNKNYPEFNHLANMMDRDMKKQIAQKISKTRFGTTIDVIRDNAFMPIALIQKVVNMVVYRAAMDRYMNDDTLTEKQAQNKIKATVRQTQSMAGQKDLASIQNSSATKLFTMFYSFFSALYGQTRTHTRKGNPLQAAYFFTAAIVVPSIINAWARDLCEEGDEMSCYTKESIGFAMASIPLVRDVVSYIISQYGYKISPAEGTVTKGLSAGKDVFEAVFHDDDIDKDKAEKIVQGLFPLVKLPPKAVTQIMRMTDEDTDEWREFLQLKKPE